MPKEALLLSELTHSIKEQLKNAFNRSVWVRAEISELHENTSGHAYFELIEKDNSSGQILAKIKATCWANTYRMLKAYFESSTGESLRSGINIQFACSVDFHEVYGISLTIRDIDPSFTVGEMAMQRLKIIRRLQEDGIIDMNRELSLSSTPQRIAVISSPTAAGYGDFMDQLNRNTKEFIFYTKLFPATMQGNQAADSIIAALDKIAEHSHFFDMVAIIRGGGATAELSCFDNYELAFNCAQFPLPILTGIGHDRDESILDLIAHTRAKTPTAAAEFLISTIDYAYENILQYENEIVSLLDIQLRDEMSRIQQLHLKLQNVVNQSTFHQKQRLSIVSEKIKQQAKQQIGKKQQHLISLQSILKNKLAEEIISQKHKLDLREIQLKQSSPEEVLKKGYSLTLKDGKIVKQTSQIATGDRITTLLQDGKIESIAQ
jgi:exodeoxyribonuclease VII large subunit